MKCFMFHEKKNDALEKSVWRFGAKKGLKWVQNEEFNFYPKLMVVVF